MKSENGVWTFVNGSCVSMQELINKIASDKALSYMFGLSGSEDRDTYISQKKTLITEGISYEVDADEWLKAIIETLTYEDAYGYTLGDIARLVDLDERAVGMMLSDPSQVAIEDRYKAVGRLARLSLLLQP